MSTIFFTGFTVLEGFGDELNRLHSFIIQKINKDGLTGKAIFIDWVIGNDISTKIYDKWIYPRIMLQQKFNVAFLVIDLQTSSFYWVDFDKKVIHSNDYNLLKFKAPLSIINFARWSLKHSKEIYKKKGQVECPIKDVTLVKWECRPENSLIQLFQPLPHDQRTDVIFAEWGKFYAKEEQTSYYVRNIKEANNTLNELFHNNVPLFNKLAMEHTFDELRIKHHIKPDVTIKRKAEPIEDVFRKVLSAKAIVGVEGGIWHLAAYSNIPFFMLLPKIYIKNLSLLDNYFNVAAMRFLLTFKGHYHQLGFIFFDDLRDFFITSIELIERYANESEVYIFNNNHYGIVPAIDNSIKISVFNRINDILRLHRFSMLEDPNLYVR